MPEKQCRRCGKILPVEAFYNHPTTKDKYGWLCKRCYADFNKSRYMAKKKQATNQEKTRDPLSYMPPSKLIDLAEKKTATYWHTQQFFAEAMKAAESDFKEEEREGHKVWTRKTA